MFKFNISHNGKTFHLEGEAPELEGKSLHEIIKGEEATPVLAGYELEITGASDKSGFPSMEQVEGPMLKRLLLTYGKSMHKRPKREGKKKRSAPKPKGLKLRKTVRGKVLSKDTSQINLKVIKEGHKKFSELATSGKEEKKE